MLAAPPDAIDLALKWQPGTVTMPPFRIQVETDLRSRLEEMGIKRVFEDLDRMR